MADPNLYIQAVSQHIEYYALKADTKIANGTGVGDWATAYTYAKALVGNMTNEEKENVTIGFSSATNGCRSVSLTSDLRCWE